MGDLLREFPETTSGGDEGSFSELHPLVSAAAEGDLPPWTRAGPRRRSHMERVSTLLGEWADSLSLPEADRLRWTSAGFLHDLLRDGPEAELRSYLADESVADAGPAGGWRPDPSPFRVSSSSADSSGRWGFEAVPAALLHGPAAAVLLAREGLGDQDLLSAVAYHTVGHPGMGTAGRALICADFLEPGRTGDPHDDPELRNAFPSDPEGVLREVLGRKLRYRIDGGEPIFAGTIGLWNRLAGDA